MSSSLPPRGDPSELAQRRTVQTLAQSLVHKGRIFDVVRQDLRLPSGLEQRVEIVVHSGAVGIAALDAQGRLVLVKQYRPPAQQWLLEIPAGRVEVGEDRLAAARRELEEETGWRAQHWELLREFYPAPGFCSELLSLYLATDLVHAGASRRAHDADEEFELEYAQPTDLLQRAIDAKTLIAAALLIERSRALKSDTDR